MPTALAISPHLDDAAFSAGGLLAHLAAAGWEVVVATVFTASVPHPQGFALACQLDKGLSAETDYMALRRQEDAAAMRALGVAEPVHLPFREAPHRGYESAPALFDGIRPDDRIELGLADAFERLIPDMEPDLVLAPQAIGGHVDHVHVVRALQAVCRRSTALWWRDFPYTVRGPAPKEPCRTRFARLPVATLRFGAGTEARKEAACAAYASQIGFQFGGPDGLARRLAAEERTERFRLSGRAPAVAGLDVAAA